MSNEILFSTLRFSINFFNAEAFLTDQIIEGDNLEIIALRNIDLVKPRYTDLNEYMNGIKNWNPRVTDWNHLTVGNNILVDYPYDIPKILINEKLYTKAPTFLYSDDIGEKKFSTYLTFTSSIGSYTEHIGSNDIKSSQNFPITFGMSFSYKIKENEKYILSSFYYAYATKAEINQNTNLTNPNIPGEFGATFYYQNFLINNNAIYAGLDFEKLNTFNTSEFVDGEALKTKQYNLIFATFGAAKNIHVKNIPMGLKTSLSPILLSSAINGNKLSGLKYIFVYSIRPFGKINFNLFFKHHQLKAFSALNINRIGFGISFLI